MTYNIKITDNSPQAKSLLLMLQSFAMDYNFLQIEKEESNLSEELKEELDFRYEHFLGYPFNVGQFRCAKISKLLRLRTLLLSCKLTLSNLMRVAIF